MSIFINMLVLMLAQYSECTTTNYEGCYRDVINDRALETLIFTDRDQNSAVYSGTPISWSTWDTYACDFIERCAEAAEVEGYDTFGLQFYGECWAGNSDYTRHGTQTNCVTENYQLPGQCHFGIQMSLAVYTIPTIEECETGWSIFEGNCYKKETECTTFADAEQSCVDQGGHLTSIHSVEENDFVTTLVSDTAWIGFNDLDVEGTFVWTDGTNADYTNWINAEPNNVLNAQHCVVLVSSLEGEWGDLVCLQCHAYVCKK
uniref:Toxin candidate TRINITY_DN14951_c0_g1_i1.p1 n=1 Tax=Pachycerianthus borealis TaxID=2736680 RepID=A0A7G7WYU5_9CNID|nr:toxin candidate TRINITY_DN14951_c0_g1_i1.p1 [Pachycerianthus borealis]